MITAHRVSHLQDDFCTMHYYVLNQIYHIRSKTQLENIGKHSVFFDQINETIQHAREKQEVKLLRVNVINYS